MTWLNFDSMTYTASWADEDNANDGNTGTKASTPGTIAFGAITAFLTFNLDAPITTTAIRYYTGDGDIGAIDIDLYYDGAWHDLYNDSAGSSSSYHEKSFSAQAVEKVRVRVTNNNPAASILSIAEVQIQAGIPVVTTQAATNIDNDGSTGNGNITSDGGISITQHGVCWKKGADPVNIAGGDGYTEEGAGAEGAFTSEMTGLDNGSTYYYRAYATNSEGTSYGAAQSFYTDKLLTVTDTGIGVDGSPGITVAIPVVDTGVGADEAPAIEGAIPISDSGAGQDAVGSPEVTLTIVDAGTGVDVAKGFLPVSVSDAGTGADAIAAILAQIGVTDVGVGSEGLLIINSFTVTDSGVGVDTPGIAVTLPLLQDLGVGVDAAPSITVNLPLLADVGVGADALAIQVAFTLADTGVGVEAISLEATIPIVDTGAGVDSITGLLAQISITDSGVGQELLGILAQIGITDVGNIQDWLTLVKAFIAIADTGAGAEGDLTVNNWIPKVAIDVQYPEESDIEYSMD